MNHWTGMGRLTADPEIRYTQSENPLAIATYTLAIDRPLRGEQTERQADFIRCKAFGSRAEFAHKYFTKGMKVLVSGSIQTGSYKNNEGKTVYTTDILLDTQEFCEKKTEDRQEEPSDFMSIPEGFDEELPFV